jgi:hypothetical protein
VDGSDPVWSRLPGGEVTPGPWQFGHLRLVASDLKKPDDLLELGIRQFVDELVGFLPAIHRGEL